MRGLAILAALAALAAPVPAAAEGELTASKFWAGCNKPGSFEEGFCLGYFFGAVFLSPTKNGPQETCIPGDKSPDEIRALFEKRMLQAKRWSASNITEGEINTVVTAMLQVEFPCK